ncbi:MAG TPA: hypothetical protein ENN79_03430 [Desulfobacteraceae bacterium]|nr:hypothetical protein [Desulfobacteraceae bacterium]
MKTPRSFCFLVVMVALLVMNTGTGIAETGVTKDKILIGGSLDLAGPAAFMGQNIRRGIVCI